ncbi:nicotinate-nucleotide adenylyltransferase [Sesbania bispinosa]|nr:nicotinate-nucleotide adenylyltransferase [Sesbania bispinosa]
MSSYEIDLNIEPPLFDLNTEPSVSSPMHLLFDLNIEPSLEGDMQYLENNGPPLDADTEDQLENYGLQADVHLEVGFQEMPQPDLDQGINFYYFIL